MSNKRVLSPSPSPTPDADTLVDLQHRNKMLKPNIIQKKLSDPVRTLNVDIMNLIFDRLPIVDLGSCVSLSKAWKSAVLGWMHQSPKRVGRKLRPMNFETVPATLWQGMSIAEIRRHASSLSRMQSGKATSLFSCHGPVGYVDVGDFATYLSTGDPRYLNLHSVLRWLPLQPENNPQNNELRVYEIPRMSERFQESTVVAVFVNCDGVILVNLEHARVQQRRFLVYSPVEEKRLWDYSYPMQELRRESLSSRLSFGPVALGQSYVYCVSMDIPSRWFLVAYDFRTGKEVYRVSRGIQCFHRHSTWLAEGRSIPDRLVRLAKVNGEELLVFVSESVSAVQIVRGRDGQQVHSIRYNPAWKVSCLADPLSNQVALIWYKPVGSATKTGQSVTLMYTFSYQPGQPFTLSPLIAVQRNTPCSQHETLQPFTMTNIELIPLVMGASVTRFTIACSCLVPVHSHGVRHLALQAASDLFPLTPRDIWCYTTGSPKAVNISESAGSTLSSSFQNSEVLRASAKPIPAVYWLDHARLVVQSMNYTRVVRF